MTERFGPRVLPYRLEETELHLLQMSGDETDWSYTPVPTLSKSYIIESSFYYLMQSFSIFNGNCIFTLTVQKQPWFDHAAL